MSKIVAPSHNMSHDCSDSESENVEESICASKKKMKLQILALSPLRMKKMCFRDKDTGY